MNNEPTNPSSAPNLPTFAKIGHEHFLLYKGRIRTAENVRLHIYWCNTCRTYFSVIQSKNAEIVVIANSLGHVVSRQRAISELKNELKEGIA